jgi:pyridoxamine 5'-phosphate oxidase
MLARWKGRVFCLPRRQLPGDSVIARSYPSSMLEENSSASVDPIGSFRQWLREAEASEPNDPNAAALATCTPNGEPSVRIVLVKRVDQRGFCFFTNAESQKGRELAENPHAALCFHWKTLRRQVRVAGRVIELDGSEVDAYFHSRSRASQVGAAVSDQSRPLPDRETLVEKVAEFAEKHPGEIPRPSYWRGYCVSADRIELWTDGPDRLHDRFLFTRSEGIWQRTRLYP